MLAVYETVDLGLVSMLSKVDTSLLELLQGNHPVFIRDPIHDDALYLHHAFGVHVMNLATLLQSLAVALRAENDDNDGVLLQEIQKSEGISVQPILSTFSVERR
jgi:nucleoporin NUP82